MRVPKNTASCPQQVLELFLSHTQIILCSAGILYDRFWWESVLAGLTGQGVEGWLAMKKNKPKQQGVRGYGEDVDLEGPASSSTSPRGATPPVTVNRIACSNISYLHSGSHYTTRVFVEIRPARQVKARAPSYIHDDTSRTR